MSDLHRHDLSDEARARLWALERTKGGLNSKLHLAVDAHGLPARMIVTGGNVADCTQAEDLVDGFLAECLMADKSYDTNDLLA